jgi:hypothetical protein
LRRRGEIGVGMERSKAGGERKREERKHISSRYQR